MHAPRHVYSNAQDAVLFDEWLTYPTDAPEQVPAQSRRKYGEWDPGFISHRIRDAQGTNKAVTLIVDGSIKKSQIEVRYLLENLQATSLIRNFFLFTRTQTDVTNPDLSTIIFSLINLETFYWGVFDAKSNFQGPSSRLPNWGSIPELLRVALHRRPGSSMLKNLGIWAIKEIPDNLLYNVPNLEVLELAYPPPLIPPNYFCSRNLQRFIVNLDPWRTEALPANLDQLVELFKLVFAGHYSLRDITLFMTVKRACGGPWSLFDARWKALGDCCSEKYPIYSSLATVTFLIQTYGYLTGKTEVETAWERNIRDGHLNNLHRRNRRMLRVACGEGIEHRTY
ncbi:hypothetical protein BDN72DRAFT_857171 [Pluteus cervinus]|uniref:Uncharacterized protein n=1 Tax=Pluteus cervinus TaxID=181527 RepID=A0ACD3AWH2_9AGAR|nr:hypothetical protein BDN72DRAFT_857171 [Pluteus cervinus]